MNITAGTWTADRSATTASFTVGNFVFNRVSGTIDVESASVLVDAGGQPKAVEAVLAAGTFHTGVAKRDEDICSKKFLDVEAFPTMRFECTTISPAEQGWTASGRLHVGTSSAPLDLTVRIVEEAETTMIVEASGVLDRAAAGIRAPSFLIGREVEIRVQSRLTNTRVLAGRHPAMHV